MAYRFLIVAEITDENIRGGFILGYVTGDKEAEAKVNEFLQQVKESKQHWFDYFLGKYPGYSINGDDYPGNAAYCVSSGIFTMSCIRADDSFTIDKYIAERQVKTRNFQHEDNVRLADDYLFDEEFSNCN